MKFKLVETFDETRSMVQEYMYDVILKLGNSLLEKYIQYFKAVFDPFYDETVEQAVTDAYIEACDYGMIKGVEKTRLTSELKEYIESNTDIIDDTDELMKQCPAHLKHELTLVFDKIDDSLNEELLTEEQVIYKVTHDLTDGTPYYLNVTENKDLKQTDKDAMDKLHGLLKSPKQKYRGESVNLKNIGPLLSAYSEDPEGIHISREGMFSDVQDLLTPLNMIMLTLSTWRKQAHNNSTIKHIVNKLNIGNDYLIHHKDEKEWNNDDVKNFLIVPKGNATDEKDLRNFIHYSLHMIAKSGKGDGSQKSKSFPLYYVNDENEVCRTYLTLQLHTNKKLFELS